MVSLASTSGSSNTQSSMVFFKYGFIFLAGAAMGTAMAHRGQHHRHGHCWRRHCGQRGGDRQGRWHEQEHAQAKSYDECDQQQERRGPYYYGRRPDGTADRDTEESEYRRRSGKNKKSSAGAAAATSDY